jgi:hypothetical protein
MRGKNESKEYQTAISLSTANHRSLFAREKHAKQSGVERVLISPDVEGERTDGSFFETSHFESPEIISIKSN